MAGIFSSLKSQWSAITDADRLKQSQKIKPLFAAIDAGDLKAVKSVLEADSKLINQYNLSNETPFQRAVKGGHVSIARYLVASGADINKDVKAVGPYDSIIHLGVMSDNPEMIGFLKALGFSLSTPAKNQYTPLRHAIVRDNAEMIAALIAGGADPSQAPKNGQAPVISAMMENKSGAVKSMMQFPEVQKNMSHRAAVQNNKGVRPVFVALENGNFDAAREIFDMGMPVNCRDQKGNTPLHWALYHKNIDFAEYLISMGADVENIYNESGYTPFHTMCEQARGYEEQDITRAFNLLSHHSAEVITEPRGTKTLETLIDSSKSEPLKKLIQKHSPE